MAASRTETQHGNPTTPGIVERAWHAYRMRWKRLRLLIRARRKRAELKPVKQPALIATGAILAFATLRNEAQRLPFWLRHYRQIGVDHFLIIDNGSTDGTLEMLTGQPDVSIWRTEASYKTSRFGTDWMNALMRVHGSGHWCVVADADELLIYPHWKERSLSDLAAELDRRKQVALGCLMIELFPKGPVSAAHSEAGEDPVTALPWFDPTGYRMKRQRPALNLWVQGGPRERLFFQDTPRRAPTLNKLPFIRWHRSYVWLNSTHSALPPRLNLAWDGPGDPRPSGALLHTKFLSSVIGKSREEQRRQQHFGNPANYEAYYAQLIADPDCWWEGAARFEDWEQLEELSLLSSGGWKAPTR